ncbi:hypothetical protein FE634_09115 [Nocardioides dongxiaopingii]|uniref:hypothetical protein n=1 Tax=Nocardioides sp. S-1144 TaxID=2582905 RepID=UPI00110E3739|nr:hypothetical protein [Nocardioides sp. S-1144]QCW50531.1 hypothetical protein FE634_09115 [Nocardioides sp. S-1144]
MTTATTPPHREARPHGVAALGIAVLAGSVCGAAAALLGLALDGSAGALGALVGAGVTLLVLATGFAVVDLVAGLMPAASLMVAVLTYTLQLGLLALLLVALGRAENLEATMSPPWFAVGVIAVALAWTVCLVVHATRARIPLYDEPAPARPATRAVTPEGSER